MNFRKMLQTQTFEKKVNPIELYATLDRKSEAGPLRQAQEFVLNEWFTNRRNDRDLVVKLHTGEGKTLVGLLILQSLLNSNIGPCLYVCPNKYLVNQVCNEADKFGIPYCKLSDSNDLPNDFLSSAKILICHVQKVFNGKSIFKLNNSSVNVGAIVLDDAHACIDTIKDAFTITITKDKNENLYNNILLLFEDSLKEQGEGSLFDIKNGEFSSFMTIPYWSWNSKKTELLKLLSGASANEQVCYVWPLIKDNIINYEGYISGNKIEICPYNIDIRAFGTFSNATHRILMSATTQDDSFFVKGLDIAPEAIRTPLTNKNQKWSGEKMILFPSLIDKECDNETILKTFSEKTFNDYGVVALVPSTKRADNYQKSGAIKATFSTVDEILSKLKSHNFSKLVVIANRYDGIDLPDESCRILILDSLPYFDSLADRYEENCCPNSELINKRIAQKIEQGLGRGVRGEKDFCAIIITGHELVQFMQNCTTNKFFSPQTLKQIEIGEKIVEMAKDEDEKSDVLPELINQLIDRDVGWKEYYVNQMNSIDEIKVENNLYQRLSKELSIERKFIDGQYESAFEEMQNFINDSTIDNLERGWLLQKLARYAFHFQQSKYLEIQRSAFNNNHQLLKPQGEIKYNKLHYVNENRAGNIQNYFKEFGNYETLYMHVLSILESLSFGVVAQKFEAALKELGQLLGFESQRPDNEIRKGPDNLWCDENNCYAIFECKSEVDTTRQTISKQEAGQMNNHCAWFEAQYGHNCTYTAYIIIPTKDLSYEGDFTKNVRVIRQGKLRSLKESVKAFIAEFKNSNLQDLSLEIIQNNINVHKLNLNDIRESYSEEYYHCVKK